MTTVDSPGVATTCAIVLNWNRRDDTLGCLRSLAAQTVPVDVLVVDNGSIDDSVTALRREFPHVEVIETGRNLGYAGGNNTGLRRALERGASHLFVLNNDTRLAPDCVERLVAGLEAVPGAAAAAPKSLSEGSPERIHFAGGRISRDGQSWHVGLGEPDGPAFDEPGDTEWITGCAILVKRSALERVGAFDERFFLLFEDLDWSLRARRLGHRLCYVPSARMWHAGSQSFGGKRGAKYQYFFTRNGLLWIERCVPLVRRPIVFLQWLGEARHRIRRFGADPAERRALRRATRWGIEDYVRRRFGAGRGLVLGGEASEAEEPNPRPEGDER